MKYIVEHEILPRLSSNGKTKAIYHKTVLTQGLPESMLAAKIEKWENELPPAIKLAYLPNPMSVRLRLSAIGNDKKELERIVEQEIEKLLKIIPDHIFGYNNDTLAEVIGNWLKEKGKKLAVAESCTGGYISHLITSVAGSSEFYNGSVTAYSNEAKENILGVKQRTIEEFGAVSEQVAKEMARGVKRVLRTDYAVSTTGIAGPTGGSEEKPVGTVWIAVAGENKVVAFKFIFGDNRERNIVRSGQTALQLLHQRPVRRRPGVGCRGDAADARQPRHARQHAQRRRSRCGCRAGDHPVGIHGSLLRPVAADLPLELNLAPQKRFSRTAACRR